MSQGAGLPDPFEFLKRLWAPLGVPLGMPGVGTPGMVFPTTNIDEIDKRITELRAVESWLGLNLEMLRATIQGLEAQKATLATFRSMQDTATQAATQAAAAAAAAVPRPRAGRRRKG